jgi:ABC-type oligopeptide transport system ATPase subunit
MSLGRIVEIAGKERIFAAPRRHAYKRAQMSVAPIRTRAPSAR